MVLPQRLTKTQSFLAVAAVVLLLGITSIWFIPALFPTETPSTGLSQDLPVNPSNININFKLDVLSDPRFQALAPVSQEIVPKNLGRTNPFAPVEPTVGTLQTNVGF